MTTALVPAGYRKRLTNDMVTRPVATIGAALSAAGALAAGVTPGLDPIGAPAGPRDPPMGVDALGRRRGPSKRR